MEIKATLKKPYTGTQRADFIVLNNHNKGYEIKETEIALEAWGLTQEEQEEQALERKKKAVREIRNSYLEATDKYMIIDFPISDQEREEYKGYREYLRNYTKIDKWYEKNPVDFQTWKQDIIDSSDEGGD